MMNDFNLVFMEAAVDAALKAEGFTAPNPLVACVLVNGGEIVAEGWHEFAGDAHAEVNVVFNFLKSNFAGEDISGMNNFTAHGSNNKIVPSSGLSLKLKLAFIDSCLESGFDFSAFDLYVTLEPCAHVGRTPACASFLVACGFKRVFVGMRDAFEKVDGAGLQCLLDAGVEVFVLEDFLDVLSSLEMEVSEDFKSMSVLLLRLRRMNAPFLKACSDEVYPFVVLKSALSLDGKIADFEGRSKWITSLEMRLDAKMERSKCDAVLVGANTLRLDDCELGVHSYFEGKSLLRIVLSKKLDLDLSFKMFRDENVFVATSELASKKALSRLSKLGISCGVFGCESVDLDLLLRFLVSKKNVQSLFVEGGANVAGQFLKGGFVDRLLLYYSPIVLGSGSGFVSGQAFSLAEVQSLEDFDLLKMEGGFRLDAFYRKY